MTATATNPALRVQLDELALACRVLAYVGHEDLTSGHLSLRDPDGRGLWIKRMGIGMDEVESADDLHLLDFDGNILEGDRARHNEWPIHAEILRARPDMNVVGHTHAFYSQLFSTTDEPLRPVGKHGAWFDDLPKFKQTCQLIRTPELGRSLAQTLGGADAVFMMSHGIAFVGTAIREATLIAYFLEKAVRSQLTIASSGLRYSWPDREDVLEKRKQTRHAANVDKYWEYLVRHLESGKPLVSLG